MLTANGREIVLAYAEPGAVLGEIALLDGGERTASVIATSAGTALQLGRNAMRDFVTSHPDFAWSLMQQLARRLRTADQTIESSSEERRVGKRVSVRVDLGGRRIIKKKRQLALERQNTIGRFISTTQYK